MFAHTVCLRDDLFSSSTNNLLDVNRQNIASTNFPRNLGFVTCCIALESHRSLRILRFVLYWSFLDAVRPSTCMPAILRPQSLKVSAKCFKISDLSSGMALRHSSTLASPTTGMSEKSCAYMQRSNTTGVTAILRPIADMILEPLRR